MKRHHIFLLLMLLTTATAWAKTIPSMHADATYESISRRVFNPSASLPETIQYGGVTYQYHREDVQWSGTNGDISFSNDFEVSAMYYSDEDFASDRVITLTLEVKGTLFVDGREIAISPSYYGTDGDATEFSFGSFVDNTDKHFETLGVSANAYNRDWLLDDPTRTYWLLYAIAMQYTENHPGEYVIFRGSEIPAYVTRDGAGFNMSHVAYQNELFYLYEVETGKYHPVWSCHIIPPKQQDPTSTNSVGTFSLVYTNPKTTYLITAVPENAFSGNDHVIDVTLDENINAIHASLSSTKIKSFNVDANNHKYTTLFDNDILCEKDADGNPTRIVGVTIDAAGEKTLPASINTIAEHSLHPSATGIKLSTTNANLVCYDDAFQTWTPGEAADANSIKKYRYITLGNDVTVSGDGVTTEGNTITSVTEQTVTVTGTIPAGYEINFLVKDANDNTIPVNNDNGVFSFTMPSSDVTVSAVYTPDPAHIEQTATDEYTIHSAEGWGVFCDMLQDNATYNRFIGKTVKLDKDITVTRMAGSDNHDICGTFDGCGHTITLDGNTKTNGCYALFRNAVGATIQNLHVDGTISTAGAYAAGLISGMCGTVKIKNCRVSVNILSSQSGECSHGGLVAKNNSGTLEITGCVFDGKLLTTNGSTRCGGFVGWNGGTLTISNSLYAPAELKDGETWVGNDYSSPFACNGATISNCYYTHDFNDGTHYTAQGKLARTVEAGDYVTVEAVSPVGSPVENGTYTVSGITAYAKGITRGDAFYYGNGDEVSLTLTHAEPPAGYTFTGYTASAGTLEGTTLTMSGDGDVTINANYEFIKFTQGALSYECTSGTEVKVTACDNSLTSVTIPTTVTYDEVTYSVTAIDVNAFADCTSLKCIIMDPTTPPTLGNSVFENCTALHTIVVPTASLDDYKAAWTDYADKILSIDGTCGDNVYWSYNTDSKTLTIFGTGAMADYNDCYRPWETYCDDITTVDIRDGVTTIGDDAFYGCTAMTSVTIPNSVTTIDNGAFCDCGRLASIDIPDGVTNIGYKAFAHCSSLESIYVAEGNTVYDSRNGCNAIIKKDGNILLWGCKNTVIPTGMISIGDDAFSACTGLTSITIPESVTSIGYAAFNTCVYLTSINIPASVTTIGDEAFANCSSLESIYVAEGNTVYDSRNGCNAIIKKDGNILLWGCKNTVIPTGVISIGYAAFSACTGLTSIEIPASVTSIGYAAFRDCTGLSAFTVDEGNTIYAAEDGVLFNKDKTTLILYPMGNNRTSYTIPASVTTISDWAFESCEGLKEITIPAGVTSIGEGVFAGCTGLTSIEIPASVTTIGNYAFLDCNALTSITIPESVTSIGRWAFGGFTGLTSITIPACVTSIGDCAFMYCHGLTTVFMESTTPPSLGYDAFCECDALDAIYVPTDNVDDYKTAWSDYKDKIKGLDEIIEIALADNASNSDLIAAVNGQTLNVNLQGRTLVKDGNWNTLCLPFDVDLTDTESPLYGATVKKLNASESGLNGSTLTLAFEAETTTLHAGVPYIIKWTETGDNITNPKFTGVTISSTEPTPVTSTDGKVTFVGQYSPFSIVESGATGDNQGNKNEIIMLSSGNKLGYSKNPRTLHTFRCHFYVPTNDSQQQARSFVLDFGEGETTTGIISMSDGRSQMSDGWYDLQGRKLDKQPAKKGLYIMNGKKVKR